MKKPYPAWTCADCAIEAGGSTPSGHISCWHDGECSICGEITAVTQPRDFRYPKYKGFKA